MTRSLASRAFRTLAVASLVLTAASCGGSDSSRQRNSALPDTTAVFGGNVLNLDVTWVPENNTVSLAAPVDRIIVDLLNSDGQSQASMSRDAGNEGGGQPTAIRDIANVITEAVTTLRVKAQFLNDDGSIFSEATVEFERAVGATKSTTIETPESAGTTDSVPVDSVPAVDPGTENSVPADTTPTDTVPTDTTPVDTTPVDTTPVDTTPAEGSPEPDDVRAQISVQEEDCAVNFVAATRTITLCDGFDQIVAAGFEADGNFADTVKGEGSSIVLPDKFIGDTRVALLRLAVASVTGGLDVPTFRGEGIIEIGDGSADVSGNISVSPRGSEAVNNNGPVLEMEVEITAARKFDIDWGDETKFAFVTLNGVKYDYYENVDPPAGWDEGKPLFWRAYAIDGFGMPRLVANGAATYNTDYVVPYYDPFFELWAQTVQVFEGEGNPFEGDPCAEDLPYMITDPVTPAATNRVTIVVDRDCQNPDGGLGLMIWSEDEFDNWEGGMPIFSRMVSTRYNPRLEATLYLATGEYVIMWGDALRPTGIHSYRVAGEGSKVSCLTPSLLVDAATKRGTLEGCSTGGRRVRVYAYPQNGALYDWEGEVKLPFKDGVIDFSGMEYSGPMGVQIDIDDAPDGELLVCFENCERMADPEIYAGNLSVDASGFDGTGRVTSTLQCAENDPWSGVAYLFRNSETSWTFAQFGRAGAAALPFPGEYFAFSFCWDQETATETVGAAMFTAAGSMPNRPSNDDVETAAEITPDIGRVRFTTVSATSQRGEMAPSISGVPNEEFRSVWFKRTIAEGETSIRVDIADISFDAVIRVFRQTRDGGLGLIREWTWNQWDQTWAQSNDEWIPDVVSDGPVGAVFYVQISGNFPYESGDGVLRLNNGEGGEAEVPVGDQPFSPKNNTVEFTLEAPSATPSPDTTVPTTDSSVPTAGSIGEQQAQYTVGLEAAAKTDFAPVLTPEGSGPAQVEARTDAIEVQIPVVDLYATVANTGATVDTARPLVLRAPGKRPMVVRPTDRTVTVPVGTDTTDLSITAVDSAGKAVSAPIEVKKTVKPLVKVSGTDSGSGSSFPWLWIALGAVVVLAGGAFALRGRRTAAPTQE